jgi:hypothetical protein
MPKRSVRRGPKKPADVRWISIPIIGGKPADVVAARQQIRALLDRVLSAGREALDSRRHPFSHVIRAQVEKDMATVREARAGNPLEALSPEVWWASLRLAELSTMAHEGELRQFKTVKAASAAKQLRAPGIRARREKYQAALNGTSWLITTRGVAKWLAAECNIPLGTVKNDLMAMRGPVRRSGLSRDRR